MPGYVIDEERVPEAGRDRIRLIDARDDPGLSLPRDLVSLARWISSYYCCPLGVTLSSILPSPVRKGVGLVTTTLIDIGDGGAEGATPAQRRILEILRELPADERPLEQQALLRRANVKTKGPLRALISAKAVAVRKSRHVQAEWAVTNTCDRRPESLTAEQAGAVELIKGCLMGGFSAHLIHGVTGSGKTEVYLRLIQEVVSQGRSALVLVPEISLTPQTGGRILGRFPDHRVAILHSGLTAAQRHHQWAMVREGSADVVLGARSALFAPVPDGRLGLIVVDEEHDGSYKQDQAPRYHARDASIRRAQLAGCPVVLCSATPSLESWHNAVQRNAYRLHKLTHRAPGLRVPRVEIVDFVEERRARTDRRVHLIGPRLEGAIQRTLAAGGQVILLLNRRGFGNYVACPDHMCGWLMTCDDCDAAMVCHKEGDDLRGYVRCHHCLAEQRIPELCPRCGNRITVFGFGTQRVEEELKRKFAGLATEGAMLRVDADTMPHVSAWHDALGRFGRGEIRLLVGTQMIAKGLDFPGVRLVGVVNADTAINLPDFRAAERTFQLVAQVVGRCGRGEDGGLAMIQTFQPGIPAIRLASTQDFDAFATGEMADRARAQLPPHTRMVRCVVRDLELSACVAKARALADAIRPLLGDGMRMRGPAPCPISRIAKRHRQQIEVTAPTAAALQQVLASARSMGLFHLGEELAVDVDPIAIL